MVSFVAIIRSKLQRTESKDLIRFRTQDGYMSSVLVIVDG